MQVEHFLRVKSSALEQRLQALNPLSQRDAEAFFLRPDNLGVAVDLGPDLRVNRS